MFFDLLAAVLCGGWGAERCPGDLMRSDAGRGLGLGNGERGACFVRYSIFDVQNIRYYRQECQLNERLDPRLDLRRKKKKINCHSLSFFCIEELSKPHCCPFIKRCKHVNVLPDAGTEC
jgi:hypothetical protein